MVLRSVRGTPSRAQTAAASSDGLAGISRDLQPTDSYVAGLAVLRAEKSALGATCSRVDVPELQVSQHEVTIGWSGDDRILAMQADGSGDGIVVCINASTRRLAWKAVVKLPRRPEYSYVFVDEATRRPLLVAWSATPTTKAVWAARLDVVAGIVHVLSPSELMPVRERLRRLLPPPNPEEQQRDLLRRNLRKWRSVTVVSGDGHILRKRTLPAGEGYEGDFWLPRAAYYREGFPNNKCVAEDHTPELFLFLTYPDVIRVDSLSDKWSPEAEIPVGSHASYGYRTPLNDAERFTVYGWGMVPELHEACISSNGFSLAFVRSVDHSKGFSLSGGGSSYSAEMVLWELRVVSPTQNLGLVDFTAQISRFQNPGTPPMHWAEPPDAGPGTFISISRPALSPHGSRIAYVKNDALWVADISNVM
jgi:hypothetical protein